MTMSNFPGGFSDGVLLQEVPVTVSPSAKVLWVYNGTNLLPGQKAGSNGNKGTFNAPYSTLTYALTQTTASRGDVVMVKAGHAETITTAIVPTAGTQIIGLGTGRSRPAFTASGAIDLFNISAHNVRISNIRVIGAAADVTAFFNAGGGDDCVLENIAFQQAETPLACITAADGDRWIIQGCTLVSTANGPDFFIDIESSTCDHWIIRNCFLNWMTNGLDLAVFRANADAATGWIVQDVTAIGLDAACLFLDFNSSHAVGEGLINRCVWQHNAAATIANGLDLGGQGVFQSGGTDGPTRAPLLPATTGS